MPAQASRPAIFLDRDGTIIEDTGYPRDPSLVQFVTGAAEGLKRLQEKGYLLFVISNQSGVGRGIISDSEFKAVHAKVCDLLKSEGIEITEFAYCFHTPDDKCACRKPEPKLAKEIARDFNIDLSRSAMVGDRESDLVLADRLGIQGYLVETGVGSQTLTNLGDTLPQNWKTVSHLLALSDLVS